MPWLAPEEPIDVTTRLPYAVDAPLVVVTAVSILVGLLMIVIGLQWIPIAELGEDAWMLALLGATFFFSGIFLGIQGASDWLHRHRTSNARSPVIDYAGDLMCDGNADRLGATFGTNGAEEDANDGLRVCR